MSSWKKWFESKSVWLGLLTLTISILSFLNGEEWIKEYPKAVAIIGTVIGILTIVLRYLAQQPMRATMEIKEIGPKNWLKENVKKIRK